MRLEADAVLLEHQGHPPIAMTCYDPYRLAWVGSSLLVSTVEHDVLLFHDLAKTLAAVSRPPNTG